MQRIIRTFASGYNKTTGGKIMTLVTTRFYNAEGMCYRKHRGEPRKGDTFERNSKDAARIEIWYTGLHRFGQKDFTLDKQGRWVGNIEKTANGYWRDVLAKKQTLMHITREQVSDEEAQNIISQQVAAAMDAARDTIAWCKPEDENDEDGRYWLSAYRGAGVYRLVIKNKRILGSIPGGFHDSRRLCGICAEAWQQALMTAVTEKAGNDVDLVKADGSGTYFYLRNGEDADLISTREYDVPSAQGGLHHNIEIR